MTDAVRHGGEEFSGAAMVPVATSLRWSRPDLTAGLAGHVADGALPGDPGLWLLAAGWRVHGTAATGDSRVAVVAVLAELDASGADLGSEDALRLVVEIAAASQDNGDTSVARRLAARVLDGAAGSAELRLDARLVLIRCATAAGDLGAIDGLVDAARRDARALPGGAPLAAVALAEGVARRSSGREAEAAAIAADGLELLGVGPGSAGRPASPHLADSLSALRIGALQGAGRASEARLLAADVHRGSALPSRQAAQLQLVVARARGGAADTTERALKVAADLATAVDVPGLAGACRVALGDLAERRGALDVALAELRAGAAAEQREKERGRAHRELVAAFEARLDSAVRRSRPVPRPPERTLVAEPAGERTVGTRRELSGGAQLSAIDALLDGLDAVAGSGGGTEPLAEPRPVLGPRARRRAASESSAADSSVPGAATANTAPESAAVPAANARDRTVWTTDAPAKPRRRTMATAVPLGESGAGRARPSYGALLGDALISELRAAGRWSDESDPAGTWPRLGRTSTDRPAVAGGRAARRREREDSDLQGDRTDTLGARSAAGSGDALGALADRSGRPSDLLSPSGVDGTAAGDRRGADLAGLPGSGSAVAGGSSAGEPSAAARAADDWLRSAIAELDRVWGPPDLGSRSRPDRGPIDTGDLLGAGGLRDVGLGSADRSDDQRRSAALGGADLGSARAGSADLSGPGTGERSGSGLTIGAGEVAERDPASGTSVVVDLVGEDRRLDSAEVRRILRGLTDRMRVHLPSRGRVRDEDPATLHVDLPGRDRGEAATWLDPVLRDLGRSIEPGAVVAGTRLRATVHGTDGSTGVQLIHAIAGGRTAGFRIEDMEVRPGSGGRRHRRSAGDVGSGAERTGSTGDVLSDAADISSRRQTGAPAGVSGGAADAPAAPRTAAAGEAPAGSGAAGQGGEDEPALGLGDLLAGAMAAYRGL